MIKNYFKIAWRNILNNKVYSSINTLGFALGMAVAILIGLWVWDELSYNHYYETYNRMAEVMITNTFNGQTKTNESVAMPLGDELRVKYGSYFKNVALSSGGATFIVAVGDKKISRIWYVGTAGPPVYA